MYSYDHDLAAFVAIGSATVSGDGSLISSDPGIGVSKAGWHCGGNPNTVGSVGTCATCKKCEGSGCGIDFSKTNADCEEKGVCGFCKGGNCAPDKLRKSETCCGGVKHDNSAQCCLPDAGFGFMSQYNRGVTAADLHIDAKLCPNRQQSKNWPPGGKDGVAIDGCSVPPGVDSALFPPGIFVTNPSQIPNAPLPSLSAAMYNACAIHDKCYQTCRSDQGVCDTALKQDLNSECAFIPDTEVTVIYINDFGVEFTLRVKDICYDQVGKIYAGVYVFGFIAHNQRQNETCDCCPEGGP